MRVFESDVLALKDLQCRLVLDGCRSHRGLQPTQASVLRAAIHHYAHVATSDQRRESFDVANGCIGMDVHEDAAAVAEERERQERQSEV